MKNRLDRVMWQQLFKLSTGSGGSLQGQLREQMVSAILDGRMPVKQALPSSRQLAKQLGVARNTIVLAYQRLVDEGFLIGLERRGYFINEQMLKGRVNRTRGLKLEKNSEVDWEGRFSFKPSAQRNIRKPRNWERYKYPFIYGQPDPALVPISDWRECCRQALSVASIQETSRDRVDTDDPLLVEQIQARLLPRRGIWASSEEILVTMGAQQALYLIASLLVSDKQIVGIEDPGYPDARNIFAKSNPTLVALPVDDKGVKVGSRMAECDFVYVTPSHQAPTTVTLSKKRRQKLLDQAMAADFLIIEDDYESETNFLGNPTPALKSNDRNGRVIYVGSLSKTLAPGLRMGFMVAPAPLIREARTLRRLMVRHPPANNQRSVALFLSLGHHDSLVNRLSQSYRERWQVMGDALNEYLPETAHIPTFGGTAWWVEGPNGLDSKQLYQRGLEEGILIEPGEVYFMRKNPPKNYFRLGFSSIPLERIQPGISILARLVHELGGN